MLKQDVMNNSQKQLLDLVKLAIHPEIEIPESLKVGTIDWKEVLEEAKKQSLMGVAFVGFKIWFTSDYAKKSGAAIDKRLLMQWVGICEKIREDNLLLNKRTSQVCSNFAKDGFRTSVMKGQGNAMLYGENLSLMRSSGDIDVWAEGGFEKVNDYVQKIAPTSHISEKEIVFDVFSDTEVEVHYRPYIMRNPFRNRRLQKFFASQAEACFTNKVKLSAINKDGEKTMVEAFVTTNTFNLVHQLAHVHRHLFAVGMGLRHVMDYYFQLIHAEKALSREEKDEVILVVKSIGLERLACALTWILVEHFGLPKSCQLWETNKEDGKFLLEDILRTGNFGHGDEILSKTSKKNDAKSITYVLRRNWAMSRFDRTDWFWGPVSRLYYSFWRKWKGFTV